MKMYKRNVNYVATKIKKPFLKVKEILRPKHKCKKGVVAPFAI